jgi:hypothetical protein
VRDFDSQQDDRVSHKSVFKNYNILLSCPDKELQTPMRKNKKGNTNSSQNSLHYDKPRGAMT